MAKIRTDRLLKLADFLETIPSAAFEIDGWQTKEPNKPEGERPGECGFAGCAMGWAAHAKLFPGLSFVKKVGFNDVEWWDLRFVPDAGEEVFGFDAASDAMGLTPSNAYSLFDPDYYFDEDGSPYNPTPKEVAERIRDFVKANSSSPSGASPRA